jgi:NADH-quinone oxidoreductase subunit J
MMLFVFALVAALVLVSAVWVVTLNNLFRAALSLGLSLLGIAALFILLEAEFLAFVQILVYVGAVLTLIIFGIMLTAKLQGSAGTAVSRRRFPAGVASMTLFILLVTTTQPLLWPTSPPTEAVRLESLGQQLVTRLVLPFEVISLVFVVAIVGAIAIAARIPRRQ